MRHALAAAAVLALLAAAPRPRSFPRRPASETPPPRAVIPPDRPKSVQTLVARQEPRSRHAAP